MPRRLKSDSEPKTGYGEGGVHEEKIGSGRWIAELDGIRRRARSEAEALEKLKLLQERRDARLKLKKGSLTLLAWLTIWLDEYCDHLKPKTLEGYRDVVRTYIEPYPIARVRLEDLEADDIVQWLKALRRKKATRGNQPSDEHISSGTIAIAFRRLRKALNVAKKHKCIRENPAADVDPPVIESTRDPVVLEAEQIVSFLAAWAGRRLYVLYAVFVTVGLRRGELLGLRWKDIDLEQRTITVRGQLQWTKGEAGERRRPRWIPSPKTRAGKRIIDISIELADLLVQWRRTQREERQIHPEWPVSEYVFINQEGRPHNPRHLHDDFKAGLKRAGLPLEMTMHDLRHCAGSLMLERGEDIEAVRELLGHSSRSVTEKIYAHALRNRKRRAGESLGYLLRKEDHVIQ